MCFVTLTYLACTKGGSAVPGKLVVVFFCVFLVFLLARTKGGAAVPGKLVVDPVALPCHFGVHPRKPVLHFYLIIYLYNFVQLCGGDVLCHLGVHPGKPVLRLAKIGDRKILFCGIAIKES